MTFTKKLQIIKSDKKEGNFDTFRKKENPFLQSKTILHLCYIDQNPAKKKLGHAFNLDMYNLKCETHMYGVIWCLTEK